MNSAGLALGFDNNPQVFRRRSVSVDRRDVVVTAAIALVAAVAALAYLATARRAHVPFDAYQAEFGPAVMVACGHGFVNPVAPPSSPLASFLDQTNDRLACEQIDTTRRAELDPYQRMTRYLLLMAAAAWRAGGISWPTLDVIAAVFSAAAFALCYVLFRLVAPRWLAITATLLWLSSPIHLFHLTALRDYAKAPFFLATAW
jgi:hypothetical protein